MNITNNKNKLVDKVLIQCFLNGDNTCFNTLYSRYKKQIYSYLNKLLPNQSSLVDDIFQDTWIVVIKKLPKYRDNQKFLAWSIRIAHNLTIDYFRKNKKISFIENVELERNIFLDTEENALNKLEEKEMKVFVNKAIDNLPFEQKEVVLLRQNNISFKEIAVISDCSINTALARMQYAIKGLKVILTKMNIEDIL